MRASRRGWRHTREGWVSNDPAKVAALFTDDAVYSQDAFQPDLHGREEIVRRWTAGISQDVEMTADVWALEGDTALVHWDVITHNHGDPVRVQYDGVLILRCDDARCREHREFFLRREMH